MPAGGFYPEAKLAASDRDSPRFRVRANLQDEEYDVMPIRRPPGLHWLLCTLVVGGVVGTASPGRGQERIPPRTKVADKRMLIGYNEYRTDLKTGDACDQSTLSCVVNADAHVCWRWSHGPVLPIVGRSPQLVLAIGHERTEQVAVGRLGQADWSALAL